MKVRFAVAAAVVMMGATAPSAMGAAIGSARACYREGGTAQFIGAGFQPLQPIALSIDGRQLATGPAEANGTVIARVSLGTIARSEQTRMLTMTQVTNPALTATKAFQQTKLYVVTKPSRFRPGRRLRIRAGGFYGAGPSLYAHVRGPKRRNLRIGGVKGACGKVSATRKRILKKGDSPGFYLVQFDTARRYSASTALQFRRAYTIRRIFRFSRSSSFSAPVFGPRGGASADAASIG